MTTIDVQTLRLAIFADVMTDDSAAELLPAIRFGVRVSLFVNDFGGNTTGTVLRVYINDAGAEVAEVELHNGRIFIQATRFLTVVSPR